jgi:F-type H+-transporting ATPase subunit delta
LIRSRVAKRYAKAIFSLGLEDGKYQQYGKEIAVFCGFFSTNKEFREVIASPAFAVEDRKRILNIILGKGTYSDMVKNFLNFLLDKNRIGAIQEISSYYESLTDEVAQIARVEVLTPRPLRDDARQRLEKALEELTSKKVRMEISEDKSLLGGLVVQIGDLVLDGSLKAQLVGLKQSFGRGE